MKIISKKEAQILGLKNYFTGLPCKRGHVAARLVKSGHCRVCANENAKHLYSVNKDGCSDRRKAERKQHYLTNKKEHGQISRRTRLRKYGLTEKEYEDRLDQQQYRCAICNVHQNDLKVRLSVDHCHRTGKIRGLLCTACNTAIGKFHDDPILLLQAINYLT